MVELLFPERIAARRAELERQAAVQRKRSAERLQQEGELINSPKMNTQRSSLAAARTSHAIWCCNVSALIGSSSGAANVQCCLLRRCPP
jgi:hypothetical protein